MISLRGERQMGKHLSSVALLFSLALVTSSRLVSAGCRRMLIVKTSPARCGWVLSGPDILCPEVVGK